MMTIISEEVSVSNLGGSEAVSVSEGERGATRRAHAVDPQGMEPLLSRTATVRLLHRPRQIGPFGDASLIAERTCAQGLPAGVFLLRNLFIVTR